MASQEEEALAAFSGHVTGLPVSYDTYQLGVTRADPYSPPYPPDQSGGWHLVQLVPSFNQSQRTFTSHSGEVRQEWYLDPVIIALWAKRKA